ncbi:MAG: hypothetical protein ACK5PG_07535 [Lysobacterales bacterium]
MKYASNSNQKGRPAHERYFEFAEAYRQAAMDFCTRMIGHEQELTWPNANVAMMLAAHSVELFLKGAVLKRDPTAKLRSHNFEWLIERYTQVVPEPELAFSQPFVSDYPGLGEEEASRLRLKEKDPSMVYRYPIEDPGVEWEGVHAFEPEGFFEMLDDLGEEFERLAGQI